MTQQSRRFRPRCLSSLCRSDHFQRDVSTTLRREDQRKISGALALLTFTLSHERQDTSLVMHHDKSFYPCSFSISDVRITSSTSVQPCPLVEDLQLSLDSPLPVFETYWLIASSATALLASLEAGLRTHRPSRDFSLASGNKGLGPSRAGLVSPIPTVRTTPEQSSTAHLLSSRLHYPAYPTVSALLQSNWAFRGTRPL